MPSLQTWSSGNHFRHPWFDASVMKRKQLSSRLAYEMEDDGDDQVPADGPPSKRRRCTTLENGFAHLTLTSPQGENNASPEAGIWSAVAPTVEEVVVSSSACPVNPYPAAQFHPPLGAALPDVVSPGSVEEPFIPEVDMKTSTWYEPEPNRIVITDLDGFAESDEDNEEAEKPRESSEFEIHPGFLEQIRNKKVNRGTSAVPTPSSHDQALVLFKPPPPLLPPPPEKKEATPPPSTLRSDEYAMDLDD